MIARQRKAHKFIWISITVLLPILIIFSTINLDFFNSKNTDNKEITASKLNALFTEENDQIKASLFENSIEVIVKSSLKTSSAVVYTLNKKGEKSIILGQVSGVGIYTFNVDRNIKGIVIFDVIKETQITKLNF